MTQRDQSTRRQFLGKTLQGALVLAASSSIPGLLEACSSSSSSPGGTPHGGTLRVGINGFPESWDSAFAANTATYLTRNVLDPLVQLSSKLEPQPALASSWHSSNGGSTWEFSLVTNAVWHDGKPFTSNDVVTHFQRILNPATGSSAQQVYGAVQTVEAVGDHGVRFTLKAPDGVFPSILGLYQGNIQAAHLDPATLGKNSMIGTGPFKWGTVVPGQSLTLVRNDKYFAQGQPGLDALEFVSFSDDQTRLNALTSGAIDVAPDIPGTVAKQIQQQPGFGLTQSLAGGHTAVYLRADQRPGNDPRIMQALKMSVDRGGLVQAALSGFGTPTGDNPVIPGAPGYVAVPIPQRDVNGAKALLAAAGYANGGPTLECVVPGGRPGNGELALGIQSMAGEAGFKISITTIPGDTFFSQYWLKQTFGVDEWGSRPTIDAQFRIAYTCSGAWNESHWCDNSFDTMLDQAHVETDPTRRNTLYGQLQQYFATHANVLIPYHFPTLSAHANSVHNFEETPIILYTDFRGVSKS